MTEIDTLEVRNEWTQRCLACDEGIRAVCTCPKKRARNVILPLCDEIDRTRVQLKQYQDVYEVNARLNRDWANLYSEYDKQRDQLTKLNKELQDARTGRLVTALFGTKDKDCPRPFALHREHDETGVSGIGTVAYGTQFNDGTVVIRWLGDYPSMVMWASLDDAMEVHGHNGKTKVVWLTETWDNAVAIEEELEKLREKHARQTRILASVRRQQDSFERLTMKRNVELGHVREELEKLREHNYSQRQELDQVYPALGEARENLRNVRGQLDRLREENLELEDAHKSNRRLSDEYDRMRIERNKLRGELDHYRKLAVEDNTTIARLHEKRKRVDSSHEQLRAENSKLSADNYNLRMENRDLGNQLRDLQRRFGGE